MKRIMMIGAGWEQVPLIKKAKAMGHWVLATNPNPNGDALAFADEARVLDPKDITAADKLFSEFNIDAVITDNCDYSLYASGMLAMKHGLPGANFRAISYSNNKRKSRLACQVAGVRQPAFKVCETFEDVLSGVDEVGSYPVILKPVDNRGNFGVNIVLGREDLDEAFFDAIANAHSRQIVLEKFITGRLLTVEGFANAQSGRHLSLAVSSKKMLGGKKGVAMELLYPADITDEIAEKAKRINNEVVKALKYDYGYTHTEYIVDEAGEIWLVESTNRGGGVYISSLILPTITGVDLPEQLVRMACGEIISFLAKEETVPLVSAAVLSFFQFPANGIIRSISGLKEVQAWPGVLVARLSVKPGDRIDSISNDANRHGFVVASAPTRDELNALVEKAKQTIKAKFV